MRGSARRDVALREGEIAAEVMSRRTRGARPATMFGFRECRERRLHTRDQAMTGGDHQLR